MTTPVIDHKTLDCRIKAIDEGTVTLYAAVFGNVDRQGEIIQQGAFTNLDSFTRDGWLALNHDWDALPVASIEAAVQDETGLLITARWHSTPAAQECRAVVKERMERSKSVKCSIGFRVIDAATEQRSGDHVRVLKTIELYEASIVNLPANARAEVTAVKWLTPEQAVEKARVQAKEGRTFSRANLSAMRDWAKRMRECATEMDGLCDQFDKDGLAAGDDAAGKAIADQKRVLRLRALRGRSVVMCGV